MGDPEARWRLATGTGDRDGPGEEDERPSMHLELDAPPGAAMRGLPHFVENAMLTQSQICQM